MNVHISEQRMAYLELFEPEEKRRTTVRLRSSEMSEFVIASAAQLSVEMVRTIRGDQSPGTSA
jgi:hypothetical protein